MRRYWTAPLRPKTFSRRTSTAVSSSRQFPGASTRRRLKPADAVTVLYSAIFATAAVLDAGNKERHRIQHDRDVKDLTSAIGEVAEPPLTNTVAPSPESPMSIERSNRAQSRPRPFTHGQRRTYMTGPRSVDWILKSPAVGRSLADLGSSDIDSTAVADQCSEATALELNHMAVRAKVASIAADCLLDALSTAVKEGRLLTSLQEAHRFDELRSRAKLLEESLQNRDANFNGSAATELQSAIDNILTEQNDLRRAGGSINLEDCSYKICQAIIEHSNVANASAYSKLLAWFANRGLRDFGLAIIDACLPKQGFRTHFYSFFEDWTQFEKFSCMSIQFCLRSSSHTREPQLKRVCDLVESFEVKALWTQHCRQHASRGRLQGVPQFSDRICNSIIQAYAKLGLWSNVVAKLSDMRAANLQPHVDTLGWIIFCCGEKLRSQNADHAKVLEIYRTAALVWPQYHKGIWETRRGKSAMWKTTSAFQAMLHLCSFSGNDQLAAQLSEQARRAGMRVEYIEAVSKARSDRHEEAHAILEKDVAPSVAASAQSVPATEPAPRNVKSKDLQDSKLVKRLGSQATNSIAPSLALSSRIETSLLNRVQGSSIYAVV